MERFAAVLGGDEGERPTVELPFDAKERLGKARAPVRGTVAGAPFRTTVAVYGITIGDEVDVTLELDDEPRSVEPPPLLAAALEGDAEAKAAFRRLSYTHRREYADWISEAKREDTRIRRANKAVAMLRGGVRSP